MIDPETIYTSHEAADILKLKHREVVTAGKRYARCFVKGRSVRFTGKQLLQLIEDMTYKPEGWQHERYAGAVASGRYRDLLKGQMAADRAKREAKIAARRVASQQESLQRQRDKAEARRQAKEAKRLAREEAARHVGLTPSPLDYKNRDPAYWTIERKRQAQAERKARLALES